MNHIALFLKDLDEKLVLDAVKKAIADSSPAPGILQALQDGMRRVGEEYAAGRYYLSELIMSAAIFQQASDLLKNRLAAFRDDNHWGTVVIGTVKNDIHDIGKNIAASLLACRGFQVVDLGVDVPPGKFVEAVKIHRPKVLGLSCLLTTCFDSMKATIAALGNENLKSGLAIMIGGATIDQNVSEYVGADAYCTDANEGVRTAIRLAGGQE